MMTYRRKKVNGRGKFCSHPEPTTLMPEEATKKFAEIFRLQQQLYKIRQEPEEKHE